MMRKRHSYPEKFDATRSEKASPAAAEAEFIYTYFGPFLATLLLTVYDGSHVLSLASESMLSLHGQIYIRLDSV